MKKFLAILFFKRLALMAVNSAEENFGRGKGMAKKRFAINFILARFCIPFFLREILDELLVELAGIAVEFACEEIKKGLK